MFRDLFRTIDRVLRGQFTSREDLQQGRIEVGAGTMLTAAVLLGCVYGMFMGLFGLLRCGTAALNQFTASTVKVPLLFLLTLLVTFPSLYVVSALFDSRLRFVATLRLLSIAVLVNLALLASFGPVVGFFTLSTDSYPFMVLLNVAIFAIAGFVGLAFLRRALDGVFGMAPQPEPVVEPAAEGAGEIEAAEERLRAQLRRRPEPPRSKRVFRIWLFIYAVVGAQMSWILRPFIGNPSMPFQWFRPRGSNFFVAVGQAIRQLFQ